LSARTVQRWTGPDGSVREDARPTAARPAPASRLSETERDRIAAACNAPEAASLPPGQIIPQLADRGEYIGSESTMCRVLRARGQAGRRGRAKAPRPSRPPTTAHRAAGPRQLWSWDIGWLPGADLTSVRDCIFADEHGAPLRSDRVSGMVANLKRQTK